MDTAAKSRSDVYEPVAVHRGTALVSGGRRGIGRAVCLDLAQKGFDIAFLDIVDDADAKRTLSGIEELGRKAMFVTCDISATSAHDQVIEQVSASFGTINCLVNNAGVQVSVRGDLLDTTEDEFDRMININLRGTFFLTRAVARHMIENPTPGLERSIITITSANAQLVSPEKGAYCISKAGLSMAMQNFAQRLAADGIQVYEIRPGLIATDMTSSVYNHYTPGIESGALCAMRRWGQPEDIAGAIGTLASGGMPFSTGDIYNVGGGMQIPKL